MVMDELRGMHVTVLMGGPGSEREVSLASGRGVVGALSGTPAEVESLEVVGRDIVLPERTDMVFNVIHGTFGEDGGLQEILDSMGVAYTGEDAERSRLAFDKIRTKRVFEARGVPTAAFEVVGPGGRTEFEPPLVVKAPREGSSFGVYICRTAEEVGDALRAVAGLGDEILVEDFVAGRELTVGVLGGMPLPVVEIVPKDGFYDYRNKYPFLNPGGGADHFCPANLTDAETALVQRTALEACGALGLEVYSRVDILLTPDGLPSVLEVNTIPGMTESSLLPESAAAAGISFPELCARIIRLSLRRGKGGEE